MRPSTRPTCSSSTTAGGWRGDLRADLIAVRGDPLADVRVLEDVRFVMKRGRIVKRAP